MVTAEAWTELGLSSLHTDTAARQSPVAGTLVVCGSGVNEKTESGQSKWDLGRHVLEGLLEATFPDTFNLFVLKL